MRNGSISEASVCVYDHQCVCMCVCVVSACVDVCVCVNCVCVCVCVCYIICCNVYVCNDKYNKAATRSGTALYDATLSRSGDCMRLTSSSPARICAKVKVNIILLFPQF